MKKSKLISLVLVCAALASCNRHKDEDKNKDWSSVNYRSDDNASYNSMLYYWMWYNAFRPYGYYNGGVYHHVGYQGQGLSDRANYGVGTPKSVKTNGISRGGFGKSSFRVSS